MDMNTQQQIDLIPADGQALPAARAASNPMELLASALDRGASVEMLDKLMTLQERWEKNNARKAFDAAVAAAKAEIPTIAKNRTVDFTSQKGRTHYRHEDMAEIARTIDPILAKNGLSYRYRVSSPPNEPVCVTCVLSHRDGHSEETTLCAGRDDSGNKNSIQAIGSTITYLQRYTLKAALGLAASNDDDGKSSEAGEPITEAQVREINKRIASVGADVESFCAYLKVDAVASIPASQYERAIKALDMKAAKAKEPA
jgi:hypothetical protein